MPIHQSINLSLRFPSMMTPICSMYGIFTYIWMIFKANVGKYTAHGASGTVLKHSGKFRPSMCCWSSTSSFRSSPWFYRWAHAPTTSIAGSFILPCRVRTFGGHGNFLMCANDGFTSSFGISDLYYIFHFFGPYNLRLWTIWQSIFNSTERFWLMSFIFP